MNMLLFLKEQKQLLKNKNVDTMKASLEHNVGLLQQLDGLDIQVLTTHASEWHTYNTTCVFVEEQNEIEISVDNEIDAIETKVQSYQNKINDLHILHDDRDLYNEHTILVNNQERWFGCNSLEEIEHMILLHEKKNALDKSLLYWNSVQTNEKSWREYNFLLDTISENSESLCTLKTKQDNLDAIRHQHGIILNIHEYLSDLQLRINTLQNICTSFKAYRAYMFNVHILPYILQSINHIVSRVSERNLSISCSLITVNTTGTSKVKTKESLKWSFTYDGNTLPLEKSSGFQRHLLSFAMIISLKKINARIQNRQLFIDEGFSTFDEVHLPKVQYMLESLKSDYDNIIVVSHLSEIQEAIPNKIYIERMDGFSKINFGKENHCKKNHCKKKGT